MHIAVQIAGCRSNTDCRSNWWWNVYLFLSSYCCFISSLVVFTFRNNSCLSLVYSYCGCISTWFQLFSMLPYLWGKIVLENSSFSLMQLYKTAWSKLWIKYCFRRQNTWSSSHFCLESQSDMVSNKAAHCGWHRKCLRDTPQHNPHGQQCRLEQLPSRKFLEKLHLVRCLLGPLNFCRWLWVFCSIFHLLFQMWQLLRDHCPWSRFMMRWGAEEWG